MEKTLPNIALIPGFATEATFSVFRSAMPADAGFTAFKNGVDRGEVKVFRWGIERYFSLSQIMMGLPLLALYREEEQRILELERLQQLYSFLEDNVIETIVCHSLGCRYVLEMMNTLGIPETVKNIYFVQADIEHEKRVKHDLVIDRLTLGTLSLTNIYCPWDQSLMASSLLQRKSRYGMRKILHSPIKNVLIPLKTLPNLHTCSMKSETLRTIVYQES
ncbi:MAG: hypothetical protein KC582_04560 [Candidatus Magasanikbacteria bacterium]|nr:hypothetical protein [Candidatus Magasanikbacteria bacterium]MCA9391500.1 hypothetical protein [Candidatus Magasanikbacteria bacterium]USN52791.1 MAG: hypothetical protein H6759_01840 [Candidatus Nomurabacteria bacterium]HPF94935.1 hypothetical protein [bacterium]